ncbi:MAG: phosphonate ABC transporter, permease protein PhnE, partial [Gemmobacter sp.]
MREAYLADVRRKRMYGGILLVLFIALMASGFRLAEDRNAGGFLVGIGQILDFPAEVVAEGWAKRAEIPGLLVSFFPSLIETINIAAVSTIFGALAAIVLALLSTRGLARWPRLIPVFRRLMDA